MTNLIVSILAVWRVTSLLVAGRESGPFDMLHVFRDIIGVRWDKNSDPYGSSVVAELFCCFWCLSVWVSLAFAIVLYPDQWLLYTLALSGGAIMMDGINKYGLS